MKTSNLHSLAAVLLGLAALSSSLEAQSTKGSPGAAAQRRAQWQQLNLSTTQKAEIREIRQTTPKGKIRAEKVAAVLTPAQKAQIQQDIAQRKAQQPD